VPIDHAEAVKWFVKAAESNEFAAYQDLDRCYYRGRGASKDLVEAYKWCLLADEFSHSYDHFPGQWADFMKGREAELSPGQIREAKRRVNEWRVQHKLTTAKP
jgi:hypothetical protein